MEVAREEEDEDKKEEEDKDDSERCESPLETVGSWCNRDVCRRWHESIEREAEDAADDAEDGSEGDSDDAEDGAPFMVAGME